MVRMDSNVLSKVIEIIDAVFNVKPGSVSLETEATDIPGWDSVGLLSLCGALDDAFELQLAVNEMAQMVSVRKIVSIIEKKKKAV